MPNAQPRSIRLFRFSGIDVFLHWSWFLVAAFEINGRATDYSSLLWNGLEYVALFAIVLLHEFGHALACRRVGGSADHIVLWPLGGVAYVNPPPRPGATLWSIAAGPLVNVALLPVLSALIILSRSSGWAVAAPNAHTLLRAVWFMNLVLLTFNLLPIYPLDGGKILWSLLWFPLGRSRSLMVVTAIGALGAAALIVVAVGSQSLWLGIISLYMLMHCWAGLQQARILSRAERPAAGRSSATTYTEIAEPVLQQRVLSRYQRDTTSLQALGFRPLTVCLEALGPYSAILNFPMLLPMRRKKEVLAFPRPYRLAVGNALLAHSDPSAIAMCMGMGIKIYTRFSDGSMLISYSFRSRHIPGSDPMIIRNAPGSTAEEVWLSHRQRVSELEAAGKTVRDASTFADYIEMSRCDEGAAAA